MCRNAVAAAALSPGTSLAARVQFSAHHQNNGEKRNKNHHRVVLSFIIIIITIGCQRTTWYYISVIKIKSDKWRNETKHLNSVDEIICTLAIALHAFDSLGKNWFVFGAGAALRCACVESFWYFLFSPDPISIRFSIILRLLFYETSAGRLLCVRCWHR